MYPMLGLRIMSNLIYTPLGPPTKWAQILVCELYNDLGRGEKIITLPTKLTTTVDHIASIPNPQNAASKIIL